MLMDLHKTSLVVTLCMTMKCSLVFDDLRRSVLCTPMNDVAFALSTYFFLSVYRNLHVSQKPSHRIHSSQPTHSINNAGTMHWNRVLLRGDGSCLGVGVR